MSSSTSMLSQVLANHAASASFEGLSEPVRQATRASILDQVGVMFAASRLATSCEPFVRMARESSVGAADVIGHGFKCSAEMAAFANGSMAHALDFEDTHDATLVHPHAAVLPAALAVAQSRGARGAELLAAVAVGADIACRIALAFEESPENPNGFTVVPLVGVYGATAAVSRLLSSPADRIVHAFSIALGLVTGSSAAQHHPSSHWRAVRDGFSARAAVTAATLAHHGLDGFERPLEGPAGYYALYAGGRFDDRAALRDLGERYHGAEVSFKPWPSCRGTHAFIEAVLTLMHRHHLHATDVADVRVRVSPFFRTLCEPAELRCRPPGATAAKFSIPFAIATALQRGGVTLGDFDETALRNPEVLALADKVSYEVCDEWTGSQSTRGAVQLSLLDGRRLDHEVIEPRGHPANPMSADELMNKFRACIAQAAEAMPAKRIERISSRIASLDATVKVADLFA